MTKKILSALCGLALTFSVAALAQAAHDDAPHYDTPTTTSADQSPPPPADEPPAEEDDDSEADHDGFDIRGPVGGPPLREDEQGD